MTSNDTSRSTGLAFVLCRECFWLRMAAIRWLHLLFERAELVSRCHGEQSSKETFIFCYWWLFTFRIDSRAQDEELTQFLLSEELHVLEIPSFWERRSSVPPVFLNRSAAFIITRDELFLLFSVQPPGLFLISVIQHLYGSWKCCLFSRRMLMWI